MPKEYAKEQLWKLYDSLPLELKEALFSLENSDAIYDTCQRYNVVEEKVPEVSKHSGRVLMGLLPPDEFEQALNKEVKLRGETAVSVAREISRFIFFPVKEVLSKIYEIEIAPPVRPEEAIKLEKKISKADTEEEKKPGGADTYREPVE